MTSSKYVQRETRGSDESPEKSGRRDRQQKFLKSLIFKRDQGQQGTTCGLSILREGLAALRKE